MKFVSANPNVRLAQNRLTYYVIIDGKSEATIAFSYHHEKPDEWLRAGRQICVLAVQHKGVNFCLYDCEPSITIRDCASVFDYVLDLEGLL